MNDDMNFIHLVFISYARLFLSLNHKLHTLISRAGMACAKEYTIPLRICIYLLRNYLEDHEYVKLQL